MSRLFHAFARAICIATGSPSAFAAAVLLILAWIVTGPLFGFSDTWQLVINTGTTIITFLMVFLIQHSQNRDTAAMELKLDELIRAVKPAKNAMLNVEELSDEELERLHKRYLQLAEKSRTTVAKRQRHRTSRAAAR